MVYVQWTHLYKFIKEYWAVIEENSSWTHPKLVKGFSALRSNLESQLQGSPRLEYLWNELVVSQIVNDGKGMMSLLVATDLFLEERAGKASCHPSINGWCSMCTCSDVPGVTGPLGIFLKSSSSFSPLEKILGSFSPLEAAPKPCCFCWEIQRHPPQQPERGTGSVLRAF